MHFKSIYNLRSFFKNTLLYFINIGLVLYFKCRRRNPIKGPFSVVGMIRASSGLGKASRLTLELLRKNGYKDTTCFDVSYFFTNKFIDASLPNQVSEGEGGVLIAHNNPMHLPIILFIMGFAKIKRKKIVMYAIYELEEIPRSWILPCELADEIWVPSHFGFSAYRKALPNKKMKMVPHFVHFDESKLPIKKPDSKKIKILTIFDINSGFYRKNIFDTIEVFSKFKNKKNVEFLIKISGVKGNKKYYDIIKEKVRYISNLRIIEDVLSDDEKNSLISSSDVIVSMHRSEGFGLVLAEAMWLKTAILCTGWSGPVTFLPEDCAMYVDYKLVKVVDPQGKYSSNGRWAQPNIDDAVVKLENLINNDILRKEMANKAFNHARKYFVEKQEIFFSD